MEKRQNNLLSNPDGVQIDNANIHTKVILPANALFGQWIMTLHTKTIILSISPTDKEIPENIDIFK